MLQGNFPKKLQEGHKNRSYYTTRQQRFLTAMDGSRKTVTRQVKHRRF